MTPIHLRVRELREAKGLSQAELAKSARVRQGTVSKIENDQTSRIDLDVLDRIATALGVDAAMLVVHTAKARR